jgi:hypothetical protein
MSTSTTTSTTSTTRTVRRFVDPDDLICPGCAEQAIGVHYLEPLQGRSPCS